MSQLMDACRFVPPLLSQVHSIAPNKVATAGKVNLVCFDKTVSWLLPSLLAPEGADISPVFRLLFHSLPLLR